MDEVERRLYNRGDQEAIEIWEQMDRHDRRRFAAEYMRRTR
jgi:hypothetical protein